MTTGADGLSFVEFDRLPTIHVRAKRLFDGTHIRVEGIGRKLGAIGQPLRRSVMNATAFG